MRHVNEVLARLVGHADRFEPRGPSLSIGRVALALAQLITLLFSSDSVLFVRAVVPPSGVHCTGLRAVSLWCASRPFEHGLSISRVLTIGTLLVVLSGYRPRLTCVPHWYVAFSLTVAMPASNGGDGIVQLATMLLIPLCLGDHRTWQWTRFSTPMPAAWRGAAFAAQVALRLQLCSVYLSAVVTKLADPLWRQGSAMFVVAHHPVAGFPAPVLDLIGPALHSFWVVAMASWSVIAVQVAIAILIWGGVRARQCALLLGVALHAGIALLMSLAVFGLIMIGALLLAIALPLQIEKLRYEKNDPADHY